MQINLSTILILTGFFRLPKLISGDYCDCPEDQCCNFDYGICGTGDSYCGTGCVQGACKTPPVPIDVPLDKVVTEKFFNYVTANFTKRKDCPGKTFYTRGAFLDAVKFYPMFARARGDFEDSMFEIAAFFAHVTYETKHLCYIEEMGGMRRKNFYCGDQAKNETYPCSDKGYYGRGPLQLRGKENYIEAGKSIGFDGLNDPNIMAEDPVMSFRGALWLWMKKAHYVMSLNHGFEMTTRVLTNTTWTRPECDGANPDAVIIRDAYFLYYLYQFGGFVTDISRSCL